MRKSVEGVPVWGWSAVAVVAAVAIAGWCWQPLAVAQSKKPVPSLKEAFNLAAKKPTKPAAKKVVKPTARKAARKPAARPVVRRAPAARPVVKQVAFHQRNLGVLYVHNPVALLNETIDAMSMSAAGELKKLSDSIVRGAFQRFFPQVKQVKLHQAIKLLPSMLRPLGLELTKPAGLLVWRGPAKRYVRRRGMAPRARLVPIVYFTIHRTRFLATLRLLGFSPRLRTQGGVTFLSLGKVGVGTAFGVLVGDRMYVTTRVPPNPFVGLYNEAQIRQALSQVAQSAQPVKHAFVDAGRPDIWKSIKDGRTTAAFVIPKASRIASLFGIPTGHPFARMLHSVGAAGSIRNGYSTSFFVKVNAILSPVLAPLVPGPRAGNMFAQLPHKLLFFSQAHIDLQKLLALPGVLSKKGLLPPRFAMIANLQLNSVRMRMRRFGVDIDKLAALLTGQFATGLSWDNAMRSHVRYSPKQGLMSGHMHGVFAVFGLRSAGAKILAELKAIAARNPILKRMLKVSDTKIQGLAALQLSMPGVQPMFFMKRGDLFGFAGSKRTADLLASVWLGAAPSLALHLKQNPAEREVFGRANGNVAAFVPSSVRELVSDLGIVSIISGARPEIKSLYRLLRLFRWVRFQTLITPTQFETLTLSGMRKTPAPMPAAYKGPKVAFPTTGMGMLKPTLAIAAAGWPLAGLPIGISAAIAIPAFLKFIRKSKATEATLYIKAIADGAISYFDAEHTDANGNPLPKHFPHHLKIGSAVPKGRSVSTAPAAKPCSGGKVKYSRNTSIWNKNPWRALKFGISREHYYQYTYISSGTGAKATFTIIARGDLDCDGVLSTYKQTGRVDPNSGEVMRSQLLISNSLE